MRDRLWDAYVPGQERHRDPTTEYLAIATKCVRYVAEKEGLAA
jgi:hypothetical protein